MGVKVAKILMATTIAVALVAVGLVVSAPGADAAAPDWMDPAIEDGRTGIETNMDTARQGSPVVFTAARCRGDGAFLCSTSIVGCGSLRSSSPSRCPPTG